MADSIAPLLGGVKNVDNKASECALVDDCFLSSGTEDPKAQAKVQRRLILACILCFIFMCLEIAGGYIAGSVAIMADAAHMMSDVTGFAVSLFATIVVSRRSSMFSYSFGYHRAEIIGALLSIMIVWAVTGALVWEAVQRIIEPKPVDGKIMFFIAVAGIIFNLVVGSVLGHGHLGGGGCGHDHGHGGGHDRGHSHGHDHGHEHNHAEKEAAGGHEHKHGAGCSHGHDHSHDVEEGAPSHNHDHGKTATNGNDHDHSHDHCHDHGKKEVEGHGHGHGHNDGHGHGEEKKEARNMNMEAAALHVLGDLLQSIGVALAGALIWYFKDDPRFLIADPLCTFLFAILVIITTVGIIRDIMHTLMERAPSNVDVEKMSDALHQVEGVQDVHDLHVWSLSSAHPILTAHVHKKEEADTEEVLEKIEEYIRKVGIRHSTVQICNPK